MSHPLRVLIVEDSEDDATLLQHALRRGGYEVTCEVVDTPAAMRALLENQNWDVITSDHAMPHFSAPAALALAKELRPDVPFIIVSGEIDINLAVSLMKGGAQDYIQKRELARVIPAIERELREVVHRHERKRADAALIESELKYRSLIESSSDAIFCVDENGQYQFTNTIFSSTFGKTPDFFIGKTFWDIYPKEHADYRYEATKRVFQTGKSESLEVVVPLPEKTLYFYATANPIKDETGKVILSLTHATDITRRKQAEEALRESEEKYRLLHESAGVGIAYYSPDGVVISYNTLAAKHMGGKPEDFAGKSLDELFPSAAAGAYMERIRKAAGSHEIQVYEDKIEMPDGVMWFSSTFTRILNSSNQVIGVQIISSDISKNKQAEEMLLANEANLAEAQQIAHMGSWEWDMVLNTVRWSKEMYRVFDINPATYDGKPESLLKVIHPADIEIFTNSMNSNLSSGQNPALEYRIVHRDGSIHNIVANGRVEFDQNGRPVYSMGTAQDITERKQVEENLRESEAGALRSESRLKMAQSVAHVGDWVWNIKDKQVEWSDEMYRIFGIKKNSYTGRLGDAIAQVIHPDDLHIVQPANASAFAEKKPVQYRILWPDGSIRYIVAETGDAILDGAGTPIYLTGTCQDITERKRAEETLRESLKRNQTILQTAIDGFWLVDMQGRLLEVNEAYCGMSGYNSQELLGMCISDLEVVEMNDDTAAHVQKVMTQGGDRFESRHRRKDGRIFDVEVSVQYQANEGGQMVAFLRDITERKREEAAFKHSHDLMRYVIEHTRSAIAVHDKDLKYLYVSQRYLQDYKVKETDVIGKHHYDVFPDLPLKWRDVHQKALAGEVSSAEDDPYVRDDGSVDWTRWECRPWYEVDGSIGGIIVYTEVITERKQAEIFSKNLVTMNPVSIQVLDKEGFTLEVNPAFKLLFGSVPPTDYSIFNDHQLAKKGIGEIFDQLRNGEVVHFPNVSFNPHDSIATMPDISNWVRTIGFPICSENEKPERFVLMQENITERKNAEEQVRQLNAELDQRVKERTAQLEAVNQELEAFSYSVSHDLRAPLRSLDGFSAVLLEDYAGQLDEQGQSYLTRIQEASRRMNQLINDLLELSRVTGADFTRQQVDLSALANSIAAELKVQSPNRRVQFEITADMIVQGDGNLLKIVLENLLNNAYKFTSRREQAIIQVGRVEQDGQWNYFVRDNGAGFNMDYANKLFGAFQRLHSEKEFPGTGIGLATVQRIIHRHGGRVWAEGMVDNGATFYFQFC